MWFLVTNNFDVKYETLILLDKIQRSRFDKDELSKFILVIETEMLKEIGPRDQSTLGSERTIFEESVVIGGKPPGQGQYNFIDDGSDSKGKETSLEESYRSLNFNKLEAQGKLTKGFSDEGTRSDMTKEEFNALSFQQKKEWILAKIMSLGVSFETQNELVDRFEAVLRVEEQLHRENQERLEFLETELGKAKQNNDDNLQEEHLILEQLEDKEAQLLSLKYDFREVKEKLDRAESEKKKLEENFVTEVLGFQTEIDQKLLQIRNLDQRNKELLASKKNFEQMIEEYKQYSEECKTQSKEVGRAKDAEIQALKDKLRWTEEADKQAKEAVQVKFDSEKIALEQTIRELMYKNKVG